MIRECRFCKYYKHMHGEQGFCYNRTIDKDSILESILVDYELQDVIEDSVDEVLDDFNISDTVCRELSDDIYDEVVAWLDNNLKDLPSKVYLYDSCEDFA